MIANSVSLPSAEKQRSRRPAIAYGALAVIFLTVYAGSMFTPGLLDDADSTHAEAAREMVVTHDYVTLHINGVRYLEKAPLPYWLVALSYKIFGVNEFSTRLPMVFSVMLLGVLASGWGRRAFGQRAGIYAALFVYTCAGVYLFTRILIPEVLLSLLIAASLYFFLTALEPKAASWRWYAAYAMVALGVLTKGLIALVFPSAAAVLFLLITGEWRRWREFRLASGTALFLIVAAPWHILAALRNPGTADHHGFLWFYFVNEHLLRFLGKRYPRDYNKLPATLYWTLHLVWLFPWSLYLPATVRTTVKEWRDQRSHNAITTGMQQGDFAARSRMLCWLLAVVVLIFFAVSTNQEYYTFPAYLPLLMLLADGIAQCERDEYEKRTSAAWLTTSACLLAVIGVTASLALGTGLWHSRNLPFQADIGNVLAKQDMNSYSLSMGHILDLTGDSFAALRLPAILASIALLIGPAFALWFRLRKRHPAATWTTATTLALFLIAAHIAFARFGPYLGSKVIANDLAPQIRADDRMIIYGDQAYGSSLLFYLKRPIELVNGKTTGMWFGSTFPDAPHIWMNDAGLRDVWASPARVFLFAPPHERARVEKVLAGNKVVVSEHSGKIVYRNH